ncbi:Anthocyanidin reductase-like [Quillaja saponaria]|uniref:Anthocyanidin reductase-like n=1 Tax=Quillaja saponaria TaxID=32244 RepID=A0AAD7LQK7_QUISA|nr:Anthocyanidin reductase-like [Quillaja saponaria]
MEITNSSSCKVCVTGGAGFIGSWLVKKLLDKGYTVHATLRNLKDEARVDLLKSLPHANVRLVLFEADIYNKNEFDKAIQGCDFVFHVATPLQHHESSQYKNISEAAIGGVRNIAMACIESGTVKKLIYTASTVSASPLKEDGSGYKDFMDETLWTSLNLPFSNNTDPRNTYTGSKTLAEKEILSYGNNGNGGGLEVVTLACGLVGGDMLFSSTSTLQTLSIFISQLTDNTDAYYTLRFLEDLDGKVPIVHVDDVCEAHIFCMENPSITGRYLCASSYVSTAEIANYYLQNYPEIHVKREYLDGPKREIKWASTKLIDKGFVYRYDTKMILDDCVKYARKMGYLQQKTS